MQKIGQNGCLIIFLFLVLTSCMAQAAAIQNAEGKNLLAHVISKRQECPGQLCGLDHGLCCRGFTCFLKGDGGPGVCNLFTG